MSDLSPIVATPMKRHPFAKKPAAAPAVEQHLLCDFCHRYPYDPIHKGPFVETTEEEIQRRLAVADNQASMKYPPAE